MYNNIKEDDKMYDVPKQKNKNLTLLIVILVLLLSIMIFYIGLQNIKILNTHGHSMQPNIPNDSYVVCIKSDDIERGDIIAFSRKGEIMIKRVVGLENEKISISEEGRIFINNEILKENYVSNFDPGEYEIYLPHQVNDDSVFVLGDNRKNSLDSRHNHIGDIKTDEIICEVKLVI